MTDLQRFISILRREGELLEVDTFVDPDLEITEITDRLSKSEANNKALLFKLTGMSFPLLINALGSKRRMAMALGCNTLEDLSPRVQSVIETFLKPVTDLKSKMAMLPQMYRISRWLPKRRSGRGRCQEVVMKVPDLSLLPILTCWPNDGGRFITLPCVHTVHPLTGATNVGMYRMQVFSPTETGMHWHKHKTGAAHYEEYKKLGKKMPVTVTLGGDPSYTFAATAPLPENIDEYILAGFLRQKGVRLVKCLTNDLWVPEDVDFVIEGYVDPAEELVWEGPFGDHTGFYSLPDFYPRFHITVITHRTDAVYSATIVGIPPMEDAYIAEATEQIFMPLIKNTLAQELVDMHMPIWGVAHNLVLVSLKSKYEGQAFKVAQSFWGAGQMMFNKVLAVFDADVDLRNYGNLFSIFKNVYLGPKRLLFSKGPLDVLDHAAETTGFGSKVCFDLSTVGFGEGRTQFRYVYLLGKENLEIENHTYETKVSEVMVLVEPELEPLSDGIKVWYVLNNIDPLRDISINEKNGGCLIVVDGRRKAENRRWPNVITMSEEIIRRVDARWKEYFDIPFETSPSTKIMSLKVGDGAQIGG